MKRFYILSLISLLFFSCSSDYKFNKKNADKTKTIPFPKISFAIISDLHYYNHTLGTDGDAFKNYIENDRKLLLEGEDIIDSMINSLVQENIKFVIVSGDITKDSEKINHIAMTTKLQKLLDNNIKVYCIPGNHDVISSDGVKYNGKNKEKVETINNTDFSSLYYNFGYGESIDRDKESLSYVTEPTPGLWLLAMDSNLWRNNNLQDSPEVDGAFPKSTALWIESVLKRAQKENKAIIGTMHHGITEHYNSNNKFYNEYIINNNKELIKLFSHYKMNYIFTGHFHSQDITKEEYKNKDFIYDIETGSAVTYPSPYRLVDITDNQIMNIQSRFVENINGISDFQKYSYDFVYKGTLIMAAKALKKFNVKENDIPKISNFIADSYTAHLKGDEIPPKKVIEYKGLSFWGKIVTFTQKDLIYGWWNDKFPADNQLTIDLKTGISK